MNDIYLLIHCFIIASVIYSKYRDTAIDTVCLYYLLDLYGEYSAAIYTIKFDKVEKLLVISLVYINLIAFYRKVVVLPTTYTLSVDCNRNLCYLTTIPLESRFNIRTSLLLSG